MSRNDDDQAAAEAAAAAARSGSREERVGYTSDLDALAAEFAAAHPPLSHSDSESEDAD